MKWAVVSCLVGMIAAQHSKYPQVESMQVLDASLKAHSTNHFDIELGFAVRRGQPFRIKVETSLALTGFGEPLTIDFDVLCNGKCSAPNFESKIVKSDHKRKTYVVEVSTDVSSPIGKYDNIILYVDTLRKNSTVDAVLYEYPFPLYFLFNPFLQDDKDVFIQDEYTRRENILNEYGNVFQGSLNAYDSQVWYYGQSKQVVLDAVFHLLDKFLNRSLAGNALEVIQTIAHNQGMMRKKTGGILVGSEDSLLEGNWGDFPFEEDNSPEIWSSTVDILNRWKSTGKPTKYGQCWVFGALETSLMRAIGVGARQVTAFGAPIDMSMKHDKNHKPHHVVDSYFDRNGTQVFLDGQQWNFHSWTDVYMSRTPVAYSGWQTSDGTPPGLGPSPVNAIHALDDAMDFNVSSVVSTVHSTIREFLVECAPNHTKDDALKGCSVKKMLKYDSDGLKLMVSSKTIVNGSLAMDDITLQYIDPNRDAFIPYGKDIIGVVPVKQTDSDELKIAPEKWEVVVGEQIVGQVILNSENITDGTEVEVNLRVTMETRTGELMKTLFTMSETVATAGNVIRVPYVIDSSTYMQENLNQVFIRVIATASTVGIEGGVRSEDDKLTWFDKAILNIDAPDIDINVPASMKLNHHLPIPISASFTNPLDFTLPNVCVTIHAHILDIHGTDDSKHTKCQKLHAGETIVNRIFVKAPTKVGTSYVVASVQGPFIPLSQNYAAVIVVDEQDSVPSQLDGRLDVESFQVTM